jgi:putative membrane protein
MESYFWVKSIHLVLVMGWVAAVFYLPRILINLVEAGDDAAVRARLVLMGRRLSRFGHVMFGLALVAGLVLVMGYGVAMGGWLHAKLGLVALLFALYVVCGRWLKRAAAGGTLPSSRTLRILNEIPVLGLLLVVWLVLAKPF